MDYNKVLKENGLSDWKVMKVKHLENLGEVHVEDNGSDWKSKVIYIDDSGTKKQRDEVFLHEVAHIKRGIPSNGELFHDQQFVRTYSQLTKKYKVTPQFGNVEISRSKELWEQLPDVDKNIAMNCRVGEVFVRGHYLRNGTYVHGFCRKITK